MAGLFDDELERQRKQLEGVGVNQAMVDAAGLLPVAGEPPKHWLEQARERDGNAKFFGKMLLGGFTGTMPFIFPEGIGGNARYKAELEKHYDAREELQRQQDLLADISGLGDGIEDPEDALRRARLLGTDGLGTIEKLEYALSGEVPGEKPKYETKFSNGQLVRYDVNNPSDVMVMKDPNGNPIAEKADGDIRKTAGWFRRAVPALENMHKLEDRGVTLSRDALLLVQQAQDADGFFDMKIYNDLLNKLNLSQDEKQYLRNAQDLAMIQLRKESGAAIGVQEMFNELNQNVMLSDMSDEGYEYQRISRGNKYRQLSAEMPAGLTTKFANEGLFSTLDRLRSNSGRVRPDAGGMTASADPVGEFFDFNGVSDAAFEPLYEALPPGTKFVGPDGKTYVKGER